MSLRVPDKILDAASGLCLLENQGFLDFAGTELFEKFLSNEYYDLD